ncbi:K(+) efflux antiporter 4 [Hordeum vulgare]|nr:K(+) efflux antiporter 4 [Hordeum vulgare]
MLMRRRRLLGPVLPRLLVALLLASAAALLPGAAGNVAEAADEDRVGEAVAAVERADATAPALGVAQAVGEAAQGNGTNKENSLTDMIDRALEKEFPDSEGDQGGEDGPGSFNNTVVEKQEEHTRSAAAARLIRRQEEHTRPTTVARPPQQADKAASPADDGIHEEVAASAQNGRPGSEPSAAPEVEVQLFRRGRGPVAVFRSPLCGYTQD